jgi:hypothetical protein
MALFTEVAFKQEIEDLHVFFENWLSGKLEKTQESYTRFEAVMAKSFCIVNPEGTLSERGPLLAGLFAAHGSKPDLRIWIKNTHLHLDFGTTVIATYEEWQSHQNLTEGRLSTVVFAKDKGSANKLLPNGLSWLHVHETWLPKQAR